MNLPPEFFAGLGQGAGAVDGDGVSAHDLRTVSFTQDFLRDASANVLCHRSLVYPFRQTNRLKLTDYAACKLFNFPDHAHGKQRK